MSRHGIIISLQGPKALISSSRRGICAECGESSSCQLEAGAGPAQEVLANNPIGAKPGDLVEFDLPELGELKLNALIWGLPLAGIIAGAVIGNALAQSDTAALAGAFIGLAIAFIPVVIYDRIAAKDSRHTPQITRVLKGPCR